jgi:DNA-binding PadR family transcriptional regulator
MPHPIEKLARHRGHRFTGRHHRGHGIGHFLAGLGGGAGAGARGFRTGRKLASGDLQLVILALLAEKPRHGYEIIKAFEERSSGFYSPSPGMVYPALTYLEEIGYATVEAEGTKKLYRVTEAGQAQLEENRAAATLILAQLERIGKKMERVRQVFAGEEAEDGEESDSASLGEEDSHRGAREMHQARRALRAALSEKRHASREEQTRVAEILKRAIDEILGESSKPA